MPVLDKSEIDRNIPLPHPHPIYFSSLFMNTVYHFSTVRATQYLLKMEEYGVPDISMSKDRGFTAHSVSMVEETP